MPTQKFQMDERECEKKNEEPNESVAIFSSSIAFLIMAKCPFIKYKDKDRFLAAREETDGRNE